MKRILPTIGILAAFLSNGWNAAAADGAAVSNRPNIVVILADDLGYGDVRCNNPAGKIATPHIDALAASGMRFVDAHAPSSVCSPTRYAIMTGRYAWRSRLKTGVLWQWDPPLIEEGRMTLPAILKSQGYRTAAFGKWHLGMNWPFASDEIARRLKQEKNQNQAQCADFDWSKPITGGPTARGFDYYFGVNCPNFSPYAFIENDRLAGGAPTGHVGQIGGRLSRHAGPAQADFDRKKIAPTLAAKASAWIADNAGKPFFAYLALTGPHSPIIPNDEFKGKSGIGDYGDWVMEMDWTVGEVMSALKKAGVADNTLVIFTSDNGPEEWNYEEARNAKHYAMGPLRGVKRDTWEGGHRVPFIASWPGHVPAGTTNAEVVCHVDFMSTAAALTGASVPETAGEDSYNILPALLGQKLERPIREATVHHGCNGSLAIRQGAWVYIDARTGEVSKEPEWFRKERGYDDKPTKTPGVLYNLADDPAEHRNVIGDHPDIAQRLKTLLEKYRREGRSVSANAH